MATKWLCSLATIRRSWVSIYGHHNVGERGMLRDVMTILEGAQNWH